MMTYYLIDRTLNHSNFNNNDDEIIIKIFVDQRKVVPKVITTNNKVIKVNKLETLENYIITQMYLNSNFTNLKISVKQLEFKSNSLVRYSDYYVGLISSMCRFFNNSKKIWDQNIDLLFNSVHKKISCFCHYAIKNQCEIISELCSKCKSYKEDNMFNWGNN